MSCYSNQLKKGRFRFKVYRKIAWYRIATLYNYLKLSDKNGNSNENVKKKTFRLARQKLCTCITLFSRLLCRCCTTSRFMEDFN